MARLNNIFEAHGRLWVGFQPMHWCRCWVARSGRLSGRGFQDFSMCFSCFFFFFREDEPILGSRNHEHPKTSFKIHLTLITLNPRFLPSNSKQHCLGVPHLTQSGNQQYPARELHGAIPQKISKMDKAWIATNLMISYRSRIVRMIAFDSRSNQLKVAREFQGTAIST